jgi:preprotein translocase subunit YajC
MQMTTIFLQASPNPITSMIPFVLIIVVFWIFFIRPQNKKQKEQAAFSEDIQKGDDVVTASGIIGKVNKLEEGIVTLEVGTKTYIRVTRNAISKEMTEALFSRVADDAKVGVEKT